MPTESRCIWNGINMPLAFHIMLRKCENSNVLRPRFYPDYQNKSEYWFQFWPREFVRKCEKSRRLQETEKHIKTENTSMLANSAITLDLVQNFLSNVGGASGNGQWRDLNGSRLTCDTIKTFWFGSKESFWSKNFRSTIKIDQVTKFQSFEHLLKTKFSEFQKIKNH